jgi:O-antigen ligase
LGGTAAYDPNDLGLFTVSTIPLCLYFLRRGAPTADRVLGFVSTLLLLIATVQTSSRGGFLALVAVVTYGVVGMGASGVLKRLVLVLAAAGLFSLVATDEYWARIATILKPQEDYNWAGNAQSGRIEVWKRGLGYMAQRPILGVGLGVFHVAEGVMSEVAGANAERGIGFKWSTAHNSYVQIGAELGVFGLLSFLILLGGSFVAARRVSRIAPNRNDRVLAQAFSGMIIGFAVGSVFLSQAYSTYLYFTLALFVGFVRVVTRDAQLVPQAGPVAPSARAAFAPTRPRLAGAMRGGLGLK